MSLRKFVADTCSNWDKGKCAGIAFNKKGQQYKFQDEGHPCNICEGKECEFLEQLIEGMLSYTKDKYNKKVLTKAKEDYNRLKSP